MNFNTLQKYLACPVCQYQSLIFQKTTFLCPQCRQCYPIINNIPILTPPQIGKQEKDQIQIFNHHYQHPQKPALWQQSMLKRIFHQPFLKQCKTYLDIGCGPSAYTINHAQKKQLTCFGIDISLTAILHAQKTNKLGPNAALLVASAQFLPFKKNRFDYISCISVLEHLKNQQKTIKLISHIIKPQGHLFLVLPNRYHLLPFFLRPIKKYFDQKIGHLRTYSVTGIKNLCQKYKLILKDYSYNGHLLKFFQIICQKAKIIPQNLWWLIEKHDLNKNPHAAQINLIFKKNGQSSK